MPRSIIQFNHQPDQATISITLSPSAVNRSAGPQMPIEKGAKPPIEF
jgi:hypothetical protein